MRRIDNVNAYKESLIVEITHEYAQSIVEKTKNLLGKNINIMNSLGIIVGSKDKSRIDTFHQGAYEVIKTGKEIEITSEQANKLEGVKPGVNLPIYLNEDSIVGVVGITGEPDEVRPFGQLLKISVETMLKQFFLLEQLRMEQNAKELYVHDIINGNFQDENMFLAKGAVLEYDMSLPRLALTIKVYDIAPNSSKNLNGNLELTAQEKREKILECIRSVFNNPQHMISHNGSSYYIILFAPKKIHFETIKQEIKEIVNKLSEKVEDYSINFCVGVGSFYAGLDGLRRSYKEAVKAIQILDKKQTGKLPQIVFAQDLSLEMMLAVTPDEIINIYKSQVLTKEGAEVLLKDVKLINTLRAYFSYNLNISKTAEELKVTRNTVGARLNKIRSLTGLTPSDFNDAVKLKVLLTAIDVK